MRRGVTATAFLILFLWIPQARCFACSSCGSGGDDPLILYPTDQTRVYLGLSQTNFAHNVSAAGKPEDVTGIEAKRKWVVSVGQRLTGRSFLAVAVPQVTNSTAGESQSGLGDPSASFRYTVLRQNFANPLIPQLQLLAGVKPTTSRSTLDADDQRTYLDAFGDGHNTVRLGWDLWSGMTPIQYGLGFNYVYAREREFEGRVYRPGDLMQLNVTVGKVWGKWKAVTGVTHSYRADREEEGKAISGSESRQNATFLTASYRPVKEHEGRLTLVDAGRLGGNKLTTQNLAITGAYIYTR